MACANDYTTDAAPSILRQSVRTGNPNARNNQPLANELHVVLWELCVAGPRWIACHVHEHALVVFPPHQPRISTLGPNMCPLCQRCQRCPTLYTTFIRAAILWSLPEVRELGETTRADKHWTLRDRHCGTCLLPRDATCIASSECTPCRRPPVSMSNGLGTQENPCVAVMKKPCWRPKQYPLQHCFNSCDCSRVQQIC